MPRLPRAAPDGLVRPLGRPQAQAAGRMVLAAGRPRFTQFGLRHWREASVASLPGYGGELGDASGLEDLDLVEHANLLSVLQVETIIGRTRSKAGATLSRPPSAALPRPGFRPPNNARFPRYSSRGHRSARSHGP